MPLTQRTAVRMAVDIGDQILARKEHFTFTIVPSGESLVLRLRMEFDDHVMFDALERGLSYNFPDTSKQSDTALFNVQCRSVISSTFMKLRESVRLSRVLRAQAS